MNRYYNILLALLFPRRCPVCGEPLSFRQRGGMQVHPVCFSRLHRIREPYCMTCGKELADPLAEYCPDCRRRRHSFICGRGLWRYDSVSAQAVFALKYKQQPEQADFFAENMSRAFGGWIRSLGIDCIVPVPVSRDRLRQRGYNQAALIAEGIGQRLGIEVRSDAIRRIRATDPQKELGRAQRLANLQRAFQADPAIIIGKERCLLVDDVYTTGATIECCTRALLQAGAGKVWFLTACIGQL